MDYTTILGWTPAQWVIAYEYFNSYHKPPKPFVFDLTRTTTFVVTPLAELHNVQRFWRDLNGPSKEPRVKITILGDYRRP